MSNNIENNNQYVIFKLENENYGIPISYVETIEKVTEITRVPNAPHYVNGVINLRGDVVPVVDLGKRFNFNEKPITNETRIIILSVEEMMLGLLVDSSSEVLTIENETIDNTSNFVNTFEDDYISGIGKVEERMIIIVDILKILGIDLSE
ncbi:chemotaxis protein CheW [Alkaliphilus peptidifermentans]|uniref:Chemotaxis protein CheW n=1 Tax=Alkaliphilus peptidifermentans DSM 18978 TaxID=1120976 RepID=A0A1G5DFS3_9FIRM|nr:chemotaxis protein CheW [Alkaliphilus peptidifermentans]SCY13397.1 purine-binding chemotaxis protein CheW [Alkaliphilus peptidifermentans DSM 18978]